jgi:TRAP transporter TAXI family solute receptor
MTYEKWPVRNDIFPSLVCRKTYVIGHLPLLICHLIRISVAVLLLFGAGCRTPAEKADSVAVVRMATVLGRVMNPFSEALAKVLPDHFPARIEVQTTKTSEDYVNLIETGQADLAMIQTDVAYLAYTQGVGEQGRPQRKLRGVAVLYTAPVRLLATRESHIRNIMDLRGKRVFVGTGHNPAEFTVKMTLEGVGLSLTDIDARSMPNEAVVPALRAGELDAVFARGNDPSPTIQQMMRIPGVSFIPITRDQIKKIRAHHPFLHSTSIPAQMYGEHPEIETIGIDMLLACHSDLPEELVYWITRTLFESLPSLAESLIAIRQIDLEHVQASPIPLHPGAARFYRGRELFP